MLKYYNGRETLTIDVIDPWLNDDRSNTIDNYNGIRVDTGHFGYESVLKFTVGCQILTRRSDRGKNSYPAMPSLQVVAIAGVA